MAFSRRSFVKAAGIGGAGLLASGRDAVAGWFQAPGPAGPPRPLLLHNNENPLGPGPAVLDALRAALGDGGPAGRYAFDLVPGLHAAIGGGAPRHHQ